MSAGLLKAKGRRRFLAGLMPVFLCEHEVFSLGALLIGSLGPLLRHFLRCTSKSWPQVSSSSHLLTKTLEEH